MEQTERLANDFIDRLPSQGLGGPVRLEAEGEILAG